MSQGGAGVVSGGGGGGLPRLDQDTDQKVGLEGFEVRAPTLLFVNGFCVTYKITLPEACLRGRKLNVLSGKIVFFQTYFVWFKFCFYGWVVAFLSKRNLHTDFITLSIIYIICTNIGD